MGQFSPFLFKSYPSLVGETPPFNTFFLMVLSLGLNRKKEDMAADTVCPFGTETVTLGRWFSDLKWHQNLRRACYMQLVGPHLQSS